MILRYLVIISLLFVSACTERETPLRLGTNVWPGYEPLYLARELGYLDPGRVRLVELLSGSEVIRAYRNGALDIAALTLDEALLLAQSGVGVQVMLVTDTSYGADVIIAHEGDDPRDLIGKRVGFESTALGAYVLSRALEIYGIGMGQIHPVSLEFNEHEKRFLEHAVDAVVTFEPVRSRLLERGGNLLFDSRKIPGEIIDVLVVRPSVASSRPEEVRHLIESWYRSIDYLEQQPRKSLRMMSPRLGLEPDQVAGALSLLYIPKAQENRTMLEKGGVVSNQVKRLNRVMLEAGLLERAVDPAQLLGMAEQR
ncbi:ABC transporter substrate-binding protein [Marinobacterium litorale]|uniref:ABC transporter substrate-binding protein n=1 Tax=Marinobacterium litorale TaxID=404770 RepID=UPI0003FBFF69|nr:ABC transporter substrate-binding protein [Marinobacterium litorale]